MSRMSSELEAIMKYRRERSKELGKSNSNSNTDANITIGQNSPQRPERIIPPPPPPPPPPNTVNKESSTKESETHRLSPRDVYRKLVMDDKPFDETPPSSLMKRKQLRTPNTNTFTSPPNTLISNNVTMTPYSKSFISPPPQNLSSQHKNDKYSTPQSIESTNTTYIIHSFTDASKKYNPSSAVKGTNITPNITTYTSTPNKNTNVTPSWVKTQEQPVASTTTTATPNISSPIEFSTPSFPNKLKYFQSTTPPPPPPTTPPPKSKTTTPQKNKKVVEGSSHAGQKSSSPTGTINTFTTTMDWMFDSTFDKNNNNTMNNNSYGSRTLQNDNNDFSMNTQTNTVDDGFNQPQSSFQIDNNDSSNNNNIPMDSFFGTSNFDWNVTNQKEFAQNNADNFDDDFFTSKIDFPSSMTKKMEIMEDYDDVGINDDDEHDDTNDVGTPNNDDNFRIMTPLPMISNSLGVDSRGFVIEPYTSSANTTSYPGIDDVLHIHTQKIIPKMGKDTINTTEQPSLIQQQSNRYWLCQTNVGDRKEKRNNEAKSMDDKPDETDNGDYPTGGATTNVLHELKYSRDDTMQEIPVRLYRDVHGCLCAVMTNIMEDVDDETTKEENSTKIYYFSIFHTLNGVKEIGRYSGRDFAFISSGMITKGSESMNDSDITKSILILDEDGMELEFFNLKSYNSNQQDSIASDEQGDLNELDSSKLWKKQIFGESHKKHANDLKIHRLFVISTKDIIFYAAHQSLPRFCILHSGTDILDSSSPIFDGKVRKIWLKKGERLISLVKMPLSMHDSTCNIAVSTTSRLMIISLGSEMKILAETRVVIKGSSLIPIGSHCVSYLAEGRKGRGIRLMYLSCIPGSHSVGIIATLPQRSKGGDTNEPVLIAVRPDRFLYFPSCRSQKLKTAITRPICLLEPLVANTLGQSHKESNQDLCAVIQRFGRTKHLFHGDNEGIGMTSRVLELLRSYKCTQALSYLLTGKNVNENNSSIQFASPWIPTIEKLAVVDSFDTQLNLLANGDTYLAEYLKNSDSDNVCELPRPVDPPSNVILGMALKELEEGNLLHAAKLLDLHGSVFSEKVLTELIVSMYGTKGSKVGEIFHQMCGDTKMMYDGYSDPYAMLFLNLNSRKFIKSDAEKENLRQLIFHLSPSVRDGLCPTRRCRVNLIGDELDKIIKDEAKVNQNEKFVDNSFDEASNIWNVGPFDNKEEILLLDAFEEWVGRCRPTKLGKEGAEIVAETGEKTLQSILAAAALDQDFDLGQDQFGDECSVSSSRLGWVNGVGEGRSDEDNLSLYIRFSDVADITDLQENSIKDLSSYNNSIKLLSSDSFALEETTSNVDEGEEGKVRILHDLVYTRDMSHDETGGLAVEIKRGTSLDTGLYHSSSNPSRQRFTLEFWYFMPNDELSSDVVLARRAVQLSEQSLENLVTSSSNDTLLWEIVLLPSGKLALRSNYGSMIYSSSSSSSDDEKDNNPRNDDDSDSVEDFSSWRRGWNHISITMSCKNTDSMAKCDVSITMMGSLVTNDSMLVLLPGLSEDEIYESNRINEILDQTVLMFGLGAMSGFRLTEIRCWACDRSPDDIKIMMYEYLTAAETKKRFKVKIRNKQNDKSLGIGGMLAPPKNPTDRKSVSILTPPRSVPRNVETSPNKDNLIESDKVSSTTPNFEFASFINRNELHMVESPLLSEDVRTSAAAALVRGPPATRHFGGNRGGFPIDINLPRVPRNGISSIAICGSEKTVIFSHKQTPAGKTYPIGASGAIISDIMDDNDNEYLCCFLAKDKRMVVFELHNKTIVVELQMTTKLNFWRFLPPAAHGDTLVFMLITPVGGFHWMPLDPSPKPRQAWKRGPELQRKKIINYEEGGSNGLSDLQKRSSLALLLTSSVNSNDIVEAWCLCIFGNSLGLCVSSDTLGAALYCPMDKVNNPLGFIPYVVTLTKDEGSDDIILTMLSISVNDGDNAIEKEADISNITVKVTLGKALPMIPQLAMGAQPSAFCLCCRNFVIVVFRAHGVLVAYTFSEEKGFKYFGEKHMDRYVIDASIRYVENMNVEVVLLLCEGENYKNGRIATINLTDDISEEIL